MSFSCKVSVNLTCLELISEADYSPLWTFNFAPGLETGEINMLVDRLFLNWRGIPLPVTEYSVIAANLKDVYFSDDSLLAPWHTNWKYAGDG